MGRIDGARVLDLFAGSGALGLEALSRGAGAVCFVERDARAAAGLTSVLASFDARHAEVVQGDALRFLAGPARPFDIVLLDPPFDGDLIGSAAAALETRGWLSPAALVYLELPAKAPPPVLPATWRIVKSGRAGDVGYHLAERTPRGAAQE